ncbi:MAG TPA: hypothetical protein VGB97_00665 [Candidatus Paceibacterota bacterium]|jgi:hypothetical protein
MYVPANADLPAQLKAELVQFLADEKKKPHLAKALENPACRDMYAHLECEMRTGFEGAIESCRQTEVRLMSADLAEPIRSRALELNSRQLQTYLDCYTRLARHGISGLVEIFRDG